MKGKVDIAPYWAWEVCCFCEYPNSGFLSLDSYGAMGGWDLLCVGTFLVC